MEQFPEISEFGTQRWRNENCLLHRIEGPAVIHKDGTELWYCEGQLHRNDGPAICWVNNLNVWYWHGEKIQ